MAENWWDDDETKPVIKQEESGAVVHTSDDDEEGGGDWDINELSNQLNNELELQAKEDDLWLEALKQDRNDHAPMANAQDNVPSTAATRGRGRGRGRRGRGRGRGSGRGAASTQPRDPSLPRDGAEPPILGGVESAEEHWRSIFGTAATGSLPRMEGRIEPDIVIARRALEVILEDFRNVLNSPVVVAEARRSDVIRDMARVVQTAMAYVVRLEKEYEEFRRNFMCRTMEAERVYLISGGGTGEEIGAAAFASLYNGGGKK